MAYRDCAQRHTFSRSSRLSDKIALLMKQKLLRFPLTFAAVVFAVTVVAAALIGHVNVIQVPLLIMNRIEQSAIDDVVTALVLVVVALVVDNIRNRRAESRATRARCWAGVRVMGQSPKMVRWLLKSG
jgi:hypothetical protein